MIDEQDRAEDPEEVRAQRTRKVLQTVAIVFKLATMHALNNEALLQPIARLRQLINEMIAEGDPVALQLVGENVFLNQEVVKLDASSFESAVALRLLCDRLGVQEIAFRAELEEGELRDFLATFQRHWASDAPRAIVGEKHPKIGMRPLEQAQKDTLGAMIDERQNVLRAFAVLAVVIREMAEHRAEGKRLRPVRLRRAIQEVAEVAGKHPGLLLGLARVPDLSGDPAFHHAAAVVYVLLMGRRLGLSRKRLMALCMMAGLHEVAGATEVVEGEDPARIALETMLSLLEGSQSAEAFERASAAVEYRQRIDGPPPGPSLFARLIAVACTFDRLATPGPGRAALPPDQVLRLIQDNAGGRFDPRVVKLFASVVGLYPVGTLVRLSSGEEAIVIEVPSDPALLARPQVKVVRDAGGPTSRHLDLAAAPSDLFIVETLDPVVEELNTASFLLA